MGGELSVNVNYLGDPSHIGDSVLVTVDGLVAGDYVSVSQGDGNQEFSWGWIQIGGGSDDDYDGHWEGWVNLTGYAGLSVIQAESSGIAGITGVFYQYDPAPPFLLDFSPSLSKYYIGQPITATVNYGPLSDGVYITLADVEFNTNGSTIAIVSTDGSGYGQTTFAMPRPDDNLLAGWPTGPFTFWAVDHGLYGNFTLYNRSSAFMTFY